MKNLDAYQLKWIAITGMFLNHVAMALPEILPFWLQFLLYAAGGVTFPIMAYFVMDGYKYTSSLGKYLFRIFLFGLIAQAPHMVAFRLYGFALNIMFTIFLGIVLILLYDKIKVRFVFWAIFVIATLVSAFFFDWGFIGVIIMIMYRIISDEKRRRVLPGIVAGIFYFVFVGIGILAIQYFQNTPGMEEQAQAFVDTGMTMELLLPTIAFPVGCFFAAYMLKHYSGERGKRMKYLFYVFYPTHFVVLGAIAFAFGLVDFAAIFNF